jgi:hypothetical protein
MVNKKTLLIIAASLISGVLISAAFFGYISSFNQPSSGDSIGVHDLVILKAYHPNGKLFYSAMGHNTLTIGWSSVLASCATGGTINAAVGIGTASCSALVSNVWVGNSSVSQLVDRAHDQGFICASPGTYVTAYCALEQPANNLITNATSYPNPLPSITCMNNFFCTGWNSSATIEWPATSTTAFNVQSAGVGWISPSGAYFYPLDEIDLCSASGDPTGCQQSQVTLSPGDSISVTVVFTATGIA